MIVAIDGPAGAGKSTVARALARRLGMGYLDTGAMYRAVAWLALDRGIAPDDGAGLAELAERNAVTLEPADDGLRVVVAGRDVTSDIRGPEVTATVSEVSAHPGVRRAVTSAQRTLLADGGWVSDGRDVGTVVWPDAEVKVFMVADPEERAHRRHAEDEARGRHSDYRAVLLDIVRRDRHDMDRAESPLRKADDAVEIDTTHLTVEQVVEAIEGLVRAAAVARDGA